MNLPFTSRKFKESTPTQHSRYKKFSVRQNPNCRLQNLKNKIVEVLFECAVSTDFEFSLLCIELYSLKYTALFSKSNTVNPISIIPISTTHTLNIKLQKCSQQSSADCQHFLLDGTAGSDPNIRLV